MAGGGNLREQVKGAMSAVGLNLGPEMLSKCLALSTSLHVTPTQLAESWEAHSLNRDVAELNDVTFDAFRNTLRKDVEATGGGGGATVKAEPGAVHPRPGLGKRRSNPTPAGTPGSSSTMVTPPPSKRHNVGDGSSAVDAVASADSPTSKAQQGGGGGAAAAVVTPAPPPKIKTPKYHERTNVGQVVATYNPHGLPDYVDASEATSAPRCKVGRPDGAPNVERRYRYMFNPLEDRARALDEHLVGLGEEIMDRFHIAAAAGTKGGDGEGRGDIAPLEAVGVPRQDVVCCIGRICNEAHEGRINRTSVLLEGSRHHSNGARVNLDLSSLTSSGTSFSLFPGQIVAVEGINASGRKLVAQRICEGSARPPVRTSVDSLMRYHHGPAEEGGQDGKPLKVVAMSGPYTTVDNLDYDPLVDALSAIRADRPDAVIMTGPFVDSRHPNVASGNATLDLAEGEGSMTATNELLFVHRVAAAIESLYEEDPDLPTQFVLVPSLDDTVAEFVYPQPPLCDRLKTPVQLDERIEYGSLGLHHIEAAGREGGKGFKRVHCVSNPCTLQINEVTIGVTSTDAMLHISTDETNANLEPGSRLTRIAQHLLQQRSYYPLFPPPAAPTMATNLDLGHMKEWSMPCQPDVLIVPSKLTTLAKRVLDSTVVVNPGMLTRGTTGGTFAVMDVHPMKRETLEGAGADIEMDHGVQDRIRVDIKRI